MRSSRHKYGARKTTVDGITFDSKFEAQRYGELKLLARAGELFDLELQPRFQIYPAFTDGDGKKHRGIVYVADFKYREIGNERLVVEDVKGVETPVFKLKLKMWKRLFSESHEFRMVKR